jgi:superfamily II DNA/RNA helicase
MPDNDIVIDNEKVILRDKLQEYLVDTKQASIAVGYFFISGFAEIMDSLKKIEDSKDPEHMMRLLISPTTNRRTAEAMIAGNQSYEEAKTKSAIPESEEKSVEKTRSEVKKTLEYMTQSEKELLAVKKLIDLIRKKKLQVKVYTKEQLHAKAYIFELDNKHLERVAIVGSSNLSISGIKQHTELNIRTAHPHDAQEVKEWFNRHWNDESCKEFTEDIADILENSWAGKKHTPSDVYGKSVLHEHEENFDEFLFDGIQSDVSDSVELFNFQKKAVSDAIQKLENYGGVIIADVVGMGKTFMGSAILKHLKENNRSKPLIICPPHLMGMWKDYLEKFGVYGEIESRYKIGMEENILQKYTHCDVILIDESHNFRNSNTNAYKALLAFMEEKMDDAMMIMLSATPISNSINDVKNQLKLFPSERLEKIPSLGTASLDEYFRGLEDKSGLSSEGVEKIRELLKHILIRRTRTQIIKKYAKPDGNRWYLEQHEGRKYFPKRNLHNPEEYDADKVYNNAYESIENAIEELNLARYAPGKFIKKEYVEDKKYQDLLHTTQPLVGIVRTSLLKRMESSIKAFDASVKNYVTGYRLFRKQLDKGIIPIGKEFHDEIYKKLQYDDYDDDQFEENLLKIKSKYDVNAFDVDLWKKEIDEDLNKFAQIIGHLSGEEFEKRDDKLHKLRDLIEKYDEKILIFSESAVTVEYIYKYLHSEFPKLKMEHIDSKQETKKKNEFVKRFDPKNNGSKISKDNELDILISTDVLSEGVNLHAGRIVINYDFHWNPVKLIQRVGRIDRIGSEHELIDIFNFLPTTKIDATLSLKDRVANKIRTIRKIIGHDQQILEASEIIDERSSTMIYNPDENDDGVLDSNIGILDMDESDSEKHADEINKDKIKKKYFQSLPLGIRSCCGKGKLLIACEAEEIILDQDERNVDSKQIFRKHYEVVDGIVKPILSSTFLKQIGNNSKKITLEINSDYDNFVKATWIKFNRDMKDSMAKKKILKHQEYFDKELKRIGTNVPSLANRAMTLSPFIKKRMRGNRQPYMKLIDLHKKIDRDVQANDTMMIEELEKIMYSKYGEITYNKIITKPKILYSMMVNV